MKFIIFCSLLSIYLKSAKKKQTHFIVQLLRKVRFRRLKDDFRTVQRDLIAQKAAAAATERFPKDGLDQ